MIADQKILDNITHRLVAEFHPEKVFLFGSYAWGTPAEDSDVDLMVIVEDSDVKPAERARRAHLRMRGIPVPLDILVKTRQEFDRYRNVQASLEADILKRGKVLYG